MGASADAFLLLSEEATAAELAEALQAKYDAAPDDMVKALTPFLLALEAENLIVRVDVRRPRGPLQLAASGSRLPFVPPSLQAYHDLQSLFLLDPVHEVGEEGWPKPLEHAEAVESAK